MGDRGSVASAPSNPSSARRTSPPSEAQADTATVAVDPKFNTLAARAGDPLRSRPNSATIGDVPLDEDFMVASALSPTEELTPADKVRASYNELFTQEAELAEDRRKFGGKRFFGSLVSEMSGVSDIDWHALPQPPEDTSHALLCPQPVLEDGDEEQREMELELRQIELASASNRQQHVTDRALREARE